MPAKVTLSLKELVQLMGAGQTQTFPHYRLSYQRSSESELKPLTTL